MCHSDEIVAREEGLALLPRFDGTGLLPAVVTDAGSGAVLMLAWMNADALHRTIETGEAWFWSRSRQRLWHKGATSGQVQHVQEIRVDCDQDPIWLRVRLAGRAGSCHTGRSSCFYRRVVTGPDGPALILDPIPPGPARRAVPRPERGTPERPKSALAPVVTTGCTIEASKGSDMDKLVDSAPCESPVAPRSEAEGDGQRIAAVGGILAALGASSCCILPLALFSLGVSGAWIGNLTALARYQPVFIAAAVACLGFGFWRAYRRPAACADAGACARPGPGRLARIGLWIAAALVLAAVTFPYTAPLFL